MILIIGAGYAAARFGMIQPAITKGLADLTFLLLTPPLLFRAMATSHFESMNFGAPAAFYGCGGTMFFLVVAWQRRHGKSPQAAAVFGLASTFSNTTMLGIPLITLAYGQAGLSNLLTIIAVHSMILLTSATLVLELGLALGEQGGEPGAARPSMARALLGAVKASVLHPVVLPIILGIAWSVTGLPLPRVLDMTLASLGSAAPPLCLVLLGASLSQFGVGEWFRDALNYTVLKNFVHPLGTWLIGRFVLALDPLALSVATLTAALPIGNNVYLFAQRYEVEREAISAGVVVSTLICLVTVPLLLWLLGP